MEKSDIMRTYEIFLISEVGTKKHSAFDILCYPELGGSIRKLRLTEENAKIVINDISSDVYLCEARNESNEWGYELYIPVEAEIEKIKNFDAKAEKIINSYPSGMVFPDMFDDDESFAALDDDE